MPLLIPPTRIISGNAEWFHTVAGYGDIYKIRLDYFEDTMSWIVSNEYGINLYDSEYALAVLKNFLCHHFPNHHAKLDQKQPHLFTQKYTSVIMTREAPYPIK